MKTNPFLLVLSLMLSTHATADDLHGLERVLFPIWTDFPVAGVSGSKWTAGVSILNPTENPVAVYPIVSQYGRATGAIKPHMTWVMTFISDTVFGQGGGQGDDIAGRIAYVDRASADQLVYINRLYEQGAAAPANATEIPIVRERDLRASISLASVPVDSRLRLMLRIYDPFQTPNAAVLVKLWAEAAIGNTGAAPIEFQPPAKSLGSTTLMLKTKPGIEVEPGYAQLPITLDILSEIPTAPYWSAISIVIEALTPGLKIWAFVSATDNQTNHVFTISPH